MEDRPRHRHKRRRRPQALHDVHRSEHARVRPLRGHEAGLRQADAHSEPRLAYGAFGEEHGGNFSDWKWEDFELSSTGYDTHQRAGELLL